MKLYNYLSPLKTRYKSKNIFAFDIETYSNKNLFLMGSIYGEFFNPYSDEIEIVDEVFWDKNKFINFVLNDYRLFNNSYIFATNLGFDFFALFENTKYLEEFILVLRGSSLITAKFKNEKKKVLIFTDTYNFYKASVKHLGEIVNISKMSSPICLGKKPKDNTEKIELENYNKIDTRITFEFAKLLQKGFNLLNSTMKITIASTSMDLFKRNFLKQPIFQKLEHIDTFYNAYYGARTEVLNRGYCENLFYYDFNSLYASVMEEKEYPLPNSEKYLKKCNKKLLLNTDYEGIVKATVYIKNIDLPYLPYRYYSDKNNYKLIFPKGLFTGYYTFFELRKAIELGYIIVDLGEAIYYTKKFKPFKEYVKTLYSLRLKYKNEKNPLEQVTKLNLNSLYGKFAQRYKENEEIYHINSLSAMQLKEYINNSESYKTIIRGDYLYVKNLVTDYIPNFIIPIFSVYVTAYGRTKLYEKIKEIGVKNVYYYDTDSIITPLKLNNSKKLGELKLENYLIRGYLVAPKTYCFETDDKPIIKFKGVPHLDSTEDFLKILRDKKYIFNKFVKFKEANSRNLKYNEILKIEKSFSFEDTKRVWKDKFSFNKFQSSNSIVITK